MRTIGQRLGTVLYWLAWPAYMVYFRLSERTRVLLIAGDEVLLLKGWMGNGKWNLAGGGLHRGERPVHGALREIREETGIHMTADQLEYMGTELYREWGITFTYHVFIGVADKAYPLVRQRREIADMQWMSVTALRPGLVSQEVLYCVAAARARGLLQ